jgi:hypothetical protein
MRTPGGAGRGARRRIVSASGLRRPRSTGVARGDEPRSTWAAQCPFTGRRARSDHTRVQRGRATARSRFGRPQRERHAWSLASAAVGVKLTKGWRTSDNPATRVLGWVSPARFTKARGREGFRRDHSAARARQNQQDHGSPDSRSLPGSPEHIQVGGDPGQPQRPTQDSHDGSTAVVAA